MATESYISTDSCKIAPMGKDTFGLKVIKNSLGRSEVVDRTEQEIQDSAYAYYGIKALSIAQRTHATLEDWETLEAEDPKLHVLLDGQVRNLLAADGIEPPFTASEVAKVVSIDELRVKKDAQGISQAGDEPPLLNNVVSNL